MSDFHVEHMLLRRRFTILFALALCMSVWLTFVTYPGALSPDSTGSWEQAVTGRFDTIKPPLTALLQRAFVLVAPSNQLATATFSIAQGVLFWSAILSIVCLLSCSFRTFLAGSTAMLCLWPLWSYTTLHWTDVWVAIFGLFGIASLELYRRRGAANSRPLLIGLALFLLAASTRHTAVVLLPIPGFWLFRFARHHGVGRKAAISIALIGMSAIAVGSKWANALPQVQVSPSLLPMTALTPYLGTIQNADPETRAELLRSETPIFDGNFGPGTLQASLNHYTRTPSFAGGLLWGPDAVLGFENLLQKGTFLIPALGRVMLASPGGFLRHYQMYIAGLLDTSSTNYPYHQGVSPNNLGIYSDPGAPNANAVMYNFLKSSTDSLLYKHWVAMLIGLLACVVGVRYRNWLVVSLTLFAFLNAGIYALLQPSWEWRYLMPSYVGCWLAFIGAANSLASPQQSSTA